MSLSQPLHEFIARYIDSIESLEMLLLLKRAPETLWMPAAIESHLGMKSGTADKRLRDLEQHGLVIQGTSGAYRYGNPREEDDLRVSELAAAYAERRTSVVNAVFSENLSRLRAFSNAFRMKNE